MTIISVTPVVAIEGYLNMAEKQMLKVKPKPIIKVNKSLWQQLFGK
jgi:hypothetical protein